MEEPLFRPVSAGMKKTAMSLADISQRIQWVSANVSPLAKRVALLNMELQAWWKAYLAWGSDINDDVFVAKVLSPLQQTFGMNRAGALGIYSIEELEAKSGRARR